MTADTVLKASLGSRASTADGRNARRIIMVMVPIAKSSARAPMDPATGASGALPHFLPKYVNDARGRPQEGETRRGSDPDGVTSPRVSAKATRRDDARLNPGAPAPRPGPMLLPAPP